MLKIKKFIGAVIALAISCTISVETVFANINYTDVNSEHWAYDYISEITKLGAFSGYEDNSFRPNDNITYQEFVKSIVSLIYNGEIPEVTEDYKLSELTPDIYAGGEFTTEDESLKYFWTHRYDIWAQPYLNIALEIGIVTYDDSDYAYSGNFFITREKVAKVIARASNYLGKDDIPDISESEKLISDYMAVCGSCRPYVSQVVYKGIMNGYTDGTFKPTEYLTRAEASAIFVRLLTNSDD